MLILSCWRCIQPDANQHALLVPVECRACFALIGPAFVRKHAHFEGTPPKAGPQTTEAMPSCLRYVGGFASVDCTAESVPSHPQSGLSRARKGRSSGGFSTAHSMSLLQTSLTRPVKSSSMQGRLPARALGKDTLVHR